MGDLGKTGLRFEMYISIHTNSFGPVHIGVVIHKSGQLVWIGLARHVQHCWTMFGVCCALNALSLLLLLLWFFIPFRLAVPCFSAAQGSVLFFCDDDLGHGSKSRPPRHKMDGFTCLRFLQILKKKNKNYKLSDSIYIYINYLTVSENISGWFQIFWILKPFFQDPWDPHAIFRHRMPSLRLSGRRAERRARGQRFCWYGCGSKWKTINGTTDVNV